jgi:hypothetical protein
VLGFEKLPASEVMRYMIAEERQCGEGRLNHLCLPLWYNHWIEGVRVAQHMGGEEGGGSGEEW